VCVFLRREVGFVDIPAELFFVSFSLQFQVKMHWNQDLLCLGGSFLFNVVDIRSEDELFVDGFVESSVPGPARV
jgi:hypothetical protein